MASMSAKHPFHLVDPSPWPLFASWQHIYGLRWCNVYACYEHGGLVQSMGFLWYYTQW